MESILVTSCCLAFLSPALLRSDTITFAQFSETGTGGNEFAFTSSANGAVFNSKNLSNGGLSIPVSFSLLSLSDADLPADLRGPQAAHMTFSVTTTQHVITSGNFFAQSLASSDSNGAPQYGTITFTRDSPDQELQETNLLTITFNAISSGLIGIRKGQTATLTADNDANGGDGDYVHFASSYLQFQSTANENLALSFSSASPCFTNYANLKGNCTQANSTVLNFLHSFTAAGTGTFASDPGAVTVFAVPEPGVAGLGLAGLLALLCLGKMPELRSARKRRAAKLPII